MDTYYTCTPTRTKQLIIKAISAGLVPFVQSSPGIGKSSIAKQIAQEFSLWPIDHRLSTSEVTDLLGYPDLSGEKATYKPFDLFPLEGDPIPEGYNGWLVILDEFNSAERDIQAAAYKLILDKQIGQKKMHENVAMICLGNLDSDKAITYNFGTAMQSRLIHLHMVHSFDDWLEQVAYKEQYDPRIISYLNQYPSELMDFDPNHKEKTYCCPRTWSFMNNLIKGQEIVSEDIPLYAGTITSGVAVKFVEYTKIFSDLPNIQQIVSDPENALLPDDLAYQWATVAHIQEYASDSNIVPIVKYISRFKLPIKIMGMKMIFNKNPEWKKNPEVVKLSLDLVSYLWTNK